MNWIKRFFSKFSRKKNTQVITDEGDIMVLKAQMKILKEELEYFRESRDSPQIVMEENSFVEKSQRIEKDFEEKMKSAKGITNKDMSESLAVKIFGEEAVRKNKDLEEHTYGLLSVGLGIYGPFTVNGFGIDDIYIQAAQRQCMMRYFLDPHAFSAIENLCSYVIGKGLKIKTASEELDKFIQEKYWDHNEMEEYHKDRFRQILLLGTWFNVYSEFDKNGEWNFNVYHLPVEEITEVELHKERFPISFKQTMPNDAKRIKDRIYPSFKIFKYAKKMNIDKAKYHNIGANGKLSDKQIANTEIIIDEFVNQMKIGLGRLGTPFMMRALKYLQYYADFIADTARLWHEQARVIWIEMRSDDRKDPAGQKDPSPAGGYTLVGIKGRVEYEFKSPEINSDGAEVVGRIIRLSINAGFRTPETITFYDASSTVYASILSTKTPYTNTVVDFQDKYEQMTLEEIQYFVERAVEAGAIPEKTIVKVVDESDLSIAGRLYEETYNKIESGEDVDIEEVKSKFDFLLKPEKEIKIDTVEVPIDIVMPQVIDENPKTLAEALKIHRDLGASRETILTKLGYDAVKELMNNLLDQKRMNDETEKERLELTRDKE